MCFLLCLRVLFISFVFSSVAIAGFESTFSEQPRRKVRQHSSSQNRKGRFFSGKFPTLIVNVSHLSQTQVFFTFSNKERKPFDSDFFEGWKKEMGYWEPIKTSQPVENWPKSLKSEPRATSLGATYNDPSKQEMAYATETEEMFSGSSLDLSSHAPLVSFNEQAAMALQRMENASDEYLPLPIPKNFTSGTGLKPTKRSYPSTLPKESLEPFREAFHPEGKLSRLGFYQFNKKQSVSNPRTFTNQIKNFARSRKTTSSKNTEIPYLGNGFNHGRDFTSSKEAENPPTGPQEEMMDEDILSWEDRDALDIWQLPKTFFNTQKFRLIPKVFGVLESLTWIKAFWFLTLAFLCMRLWWWGRKQIKTF